MTNNRDGPRAPEVVTHETVSTEKHRQYLEILTRCVHELRAMQEAGRMQDPTSRAEIEFLEQELREAHARATGGATDSSREAARVPNDRSLQHRDSDVERLPNQEL